MRGLSQATKDLIEHARQLLETDHPMTLRQLHCAIFSRREVPYENSQADYKRLSRATTVARRAYREWELAGGSGAPPPNSIPSDQMVDETRVPEIVSVWRNATAYVETVKRAYRRDNWQDQPWHCEVWSEKATIMGAVRPVADGLGITLRVPRVWIHGNGRPDWPILRRC
jgi:hypothetical protein